MEVFLAGYNIDTAVIKELERTMGGREDLTPEVLSAAYARISRDPRSITDIREDARKEVEKSRRSNSTIIFKMGHHSVAEHAVFNLDIIGVSRLAMEEVEKFRLCSYTEKSQRYITLDKDFVLPEEIKGTVHEEPFIDMIQVQNEAYFDLFKKLKEYVFDKYADLADDPKNHNMLEGWAKEDARYVTALATESQVGQTINARNLELLLRRFASHPLAEVNRVGELIYEKISGVAPSIVIFHKANDRDEKMYPEIRAAAEEMAGKILSENPGQDVRLVEFTDNADNIVAASLLHTSSGLSYEQCRDIVESTDKERKETLFRAAWKNLQFYDSMPREFEYANLTFNVVLSAACFGQLKRHRMTTITGQAYDPGLGVTVPESIREIGMENRFMEIVDRTNGLYEKIYRDTPTAAPYILTNSHRKRVLVRLNLRELYHISRLREDAHSQWDIRNIARLMCDQARSVMPLSCGLIGGKDRYNEIYRGIFGELPKVVDAVLPAAREIK